MKVNTVKPFTKGLSPLPEPPFVIRLASPDDWYKLLDDYPELEQKFKWQSGDELRLINYRNYHDLGRRFGSHASVTVWDSESCESCPILEYPG